MGTGRILGKRVQRQHWHNLARRRTSAHCAGRLSGCLHRLAGAGVGQGISALEHPAGVFIVFGRFHRVIVFEYGRRPGRPARRPPVEILCALVPGERRNAQERSANGLGDVHRVGAGLSGAGRRCAERWQRRIEAGRAGLQPRGRNPESRTPLNRKCRIGQSPVQPIEFLAPESFNPLISESVNQESWNQRITQSTNQPIKVGIPATCPKIGHAISSPPKAGRRVEQPETQTPKGRRSKLLRFRHRNSLNLQLISTNTTRNSTEEINGRLR